MSKTRSHAIDVEIYDQKYTIVLQKPIDDVAVRALAAEVDARMREISRVTNSADSLKVAVLTALHLMQEYKELQSNCESNDAVIRSKTEELSKTLEQVLKK